jgi:hypothetical protein
LRPYLEKTHHKKGELVEWLKLKQKELPSKCEAWNSNPSAVKKKKKEKEKTHCNQQIN